MGGAYPECDEGHSYPGEVRSADKLYQRVINVGKRLISIYAYQGSAQALSPLRVLCQ
jgi:hypothetical protein